jgi:hypothetical protein
MLKLVLSSPKGHKRGNPVGNFPARLIDTETGKVVPGVGEITLRSCGSNMTVTAQVSICAVETAEEDPAKPPEAPATPTSAAAK